MFNYLKSRIAKPLVLVDVGARWGSLDFWGAFEEKAKIICFEADAEETARLNAENRSSNVVYAPYALSKDDKGIELTITEGPGCSSAYEPLKSLYTKYPACEIMRPVKKMQCPSITLDKYLELNGIEGIDAIKLDTQGSELDILKGAEKALKSCKFAIIEVEFNPLYKSQALFCDVDRFMRDRGFTLWRLNNLSHYSTGIVSCDPHPVLLTVAPGSWQYVSLENGQLFWADAFYVKESATAASNDDLGYDEAIAGAALVMQWRLWDLAAEMISKTRDSDLIADIAKFIHPAEPLPTLPSQIEYLQNRVRDLEEQLKLGPIKPSPFFTRLGRRIDAAIFGSERP